MKTREKIIRESLNLFSIDGFDSVSVRDIAKAVGIKESSLYNHFKNKQDIFDCILSEYSNRGEELFHHLHLTGDDRQIKVDSRTINMYREMSKDHFTEISSKIFEFYFTDEINVKLRKMLTIEQYRNENVSKLYRELSIDSSLDFQAKLFEAFIDEGIFIKVDPYLLAVEFFAPIFLLFYKYDNDEKSLKEAKELFVRHIEHFNRIYTKIN